MNIESQGFNKRIGFLKGSLEKAFRMVRTRKTTKPYQNIFFLTISLFTGIYLIQEHDLVKSFAPNILILDIGGLVVAVNVSDPERKLGRGMGGAD